MRMFGNWRGETWTLDFVVPLHERHSHVFSVELKNKDRLVLRSDRITTVNPNNWASTREV